MIYIYIRIVCEIVKFKTAFVLFLIVFCVFMLLFVVFFKVLNKHLILSVDNNKRHFIIIIIEEYRTCCFVIVYSDTSKCRLFFQESRSALHVEEGEWMIHICVELTFIS